MCRGRPQVDGQREDASFEGRSGVTDHGVVHVVGPGLVHETLTFWSLERRQATLAYCAGPLPEAVEHSVDVELLRHEDMVWPGVAGASLVIP